ncbi:hypothetical protein [Pedobacter panaciterrae]
MNIKSFITASVLLATGLVANAQNQMPGKMHIGIVYPLSTNGTHAPLDTNNLSFNLLGGVSAAERGLAFAGLSNVVLHDAKGFLFAGFSNHVIKNADGGQFAGFLNTYGGGDGFAFAGFANISSGNVKGAQFAGFANIAKEMNGAQFAGFGNVAKGGTASQFAGFINIAKGVKGSQMAGFMNVAKDVKGSQIAGFINIAKKVKGAQIAGFINIAESSDFPIGIVNIIKNGEKSIGVSTNDNLTTMLTFRSGGRVLYGILGVGYNFKNDKEVYAAEAGMGAHFFQSNSFRLNTELTAMSLESFKHGEYFSSSFRVLPALKIAKFLEIYGGPSLNYVNTNTIEGKDLNKHYISKWGNKGNDFRGLYVGYTGGIQVIF